MIYSLHRLKSLIQQEELMGWIINGIKVAINVKNKLYAFGDEVRYRHYRNKICTLIRVRKRKYYDTFFENNMANMEKTWQGKESINFYIDGKKKKQTNELKSHICTKGF